MNLIIFLLSFILMEGVAWLTHKYIMHGLFWKLHEDHHTGSEGFFEKNDSFFLIFAIPGFLGTFYGAKADFNYLFFIGLGICAYGLAYFLIHDVLIHRRFNWFNNKQNFYFTTIRKVHKLHHKQLEKENSHYFGMLWIPFKFLNKK